MKYIIALVGESGTGKDALKNKILEKYPDIKPILRMTTRPMRENEKQDNPYIFVTLPAMQKMVLKDTDKFLEVEPQREWFYGTHADISFKLESPSNIYLGCYSAESLENLYQACEMDKENFRIIPIKIEVKDKVRLNRQLMRENNPDCYEICRRFISDKKDYDGNFDFPHFVVDNNGSLEDSIKTIEVIIESETIETDSPDLDTILGRMKKLDND